MDLSRSGYCSAAGFCEHRNETSGFHKTQEMVELGEHLLASQEELCSIVLTSFVYNTAWNPRAAPLTTRSVRNAIPRYELPRAEVQMTQNADEGQAGVHHTGTEPPEPKRRRVATRQPRYRHQREALS